MNINFRLRKECYCIDLRRALVFSGIILLLGMLVRFCSGDTHIYTLLLLPRFAPNIGGYIILGTLFYILMGFALELFISNAPCFSREKFISVSMCICAILLSYLRHFFFFWANAFFLSFIVALVTCIILAFALLRMTRLCFPSAVIVLLYLVWNVYIGFVNFCIFLLN